MGYGDIYPVFAAQDYIKVVFCSLIRLPEHVLPWMDAVCVLTNDGMLFPPLMGTGGNEGSGSYTSGYAQTIVSLLLKNLLPEALRASLFESSVPGVRSSKQTPGQFDPGRAGGSIQGFGIVGQVKTNPSLLCCVSCHLTVHPHSRRGTRRKYLSPHPQDGHCIHRWFARPQGSAILNF